MGLAHLLRPLRRQTSGLGYNLTVHFMNKTNFLIQFDYAQLKVLWSVQSPQKFPWVVILKSHTYSTISSSTLAAQSSIPAEEAATVWVCSNPAGVVPRYQSPAAASEAGGSSALPPSQQFCAARSPGARRGGCSSGVSTAQAGAGAAQKLQASPSWSWQGLHCRWILASSGF